MVLCYSVTASLLINSISFASLQQSPAEPSPAEHSKSPTETKSIPKMHPLLMQGRIPTHLQNQALLPQGFPPAVSCPAPAECPADRPLLRLFQNPIPSLWHFCLPSDQDLWGLSMDAVARKVQKLSLQCHKQHKKSKMPFVYLILTEGIWAGHSNTDSKLWSGTWGGNMDACQTDNGV